MRAGMVPSYLESLEQSPSPQLSRFCALAVGSRSGDDRRGLSGGGVLAPPGRSTPSSRPALDPLDRAGCEALISPGGVGRVAFDEPRGPIAIPVNFRVLDGDVVFRTAPSAALLESLDDGPISFEVDHIDEALKRGLERPFQWPSPRDLRSSRAPDGHGGAGWRHGRAETETSTFASSPMT